MSKMKNVIIIGAGVAAGMVVANYLTDGAVFSAAGNVIGNVKDKVITRGAAAAETVTDIAEDLGDVAADIADGVTI